MPPPSDDLKRVVVDVTKFHLATSINMQELALAPGNLTISSYVDQVTRRAVLELEAKIARGPEESIYHAVEISYPDGWWNAFKAHWLPKVRPGFLRRRLMRWFPWKNRTESLAGHVKVVRMCPHLPIPQDHRDRHLEFLVPDTYAPYRW